MDEWSLHLSPQSPAFAQKSQKSGKITLKQYFDVVWLCLWGIDIGGRIQMWVFLRKNGSFVELRHQGFIAFFVVD